MRPLRAPAGIFLILVGLYLSTYTGVAFSGDEQVSLDAAFSLYRRGTLELALFNDLRPTFPAPPSVDQPVIALDLEPLQSYLGALVAALAGALPGVGMTHALYLLNIGITALSAVMVFAWGRLWGYGLGVASGAALLYGTATFAWVHSRFFFREPLFSLLLLVCLYSLWRWRINPAPTRRRTGWLFLSLVTFGGAMLTKVTTLLFLPALIAAVIPRRFGRRTLLIGAAITAMGFLILMGFALSVPGVRFRYLGKILSDLSLDQWAEAVRAWLFSPGASLWAFSPILIAALVGAWALIRARRWRQVALPLILSCCAMGGYAAFRGWYSGLGWGPRYLLPVIPFLCLWLLPVLQWASDHAPARLSLGMLIGISVAVQIVGVSVPPTLHGDTLAVLEPARYPWIEGVWELPYTPLVTGLKEGAKGPSPLMFVTTHQFGLIGLYALLIIIGLICLRRHFVPRWLIGAGALSLILGTYVVLRAAYLDPRYGADDPLLWETLTRLNTDMRPGDALLLNDSTYRNFFMNYYKRREPIYRLPDAPAETLDPAKPPQIVSDNLEAQVHPYLWTMLARIARRSERWWFVTPYSPFSPDRLRPTEHYLARHYFPIREVIRTDPLRLLLYLPVEAPAAAVPESAERYADFGAVRLWAVDLPAGDEFSAGAVVPVSLLLDVPSRTWGEPPFDYGVNLSLINREGFMVAQHAALPIGGLGRISLWKPGERHRDNHALELPLDLAPGTYVVSMSIYDWRDNSKLLVHTAQIETTEAHIARIVILPKR